MSGGGRAQLPWNEIRVRLSKIEPKMYELEPGGALALELNDGEWMLELTPDGRLICQIGIDMEDVQSLLSDGTPEDLGTDELAKQAKYYLQPAVSKFRAVLVRGGFEEKTEMNDSFVAVAFHRSVDLRDLSTVAQAIQWVQAQFKR